MLTDNGSEFKNKTLRDLMEALEVNHQFAPAYHPQSNQAESQVVNSLTTVVNACDIPNQEQ